MPCWLLVFTRLDAKSACCCFSCLAAKAAAVAVGAYKPEGRNVISFLYLPMIGLNVLDRRIGDLFRSTYQGRWTVNKVHTYWSGGVHQMGVHNPKLDPPAAAICQTSDPAGRGGVEGGWGVASSMPRHGMGCIDRENVRTYACVYPSLACGRVPKRHTPDVLGSRYRVTVLGNIAIGGAIMNIPLQILSVQKAFYSLFNYSWRWIETAG